MPQNNGWNSAGPEFELHELGISASASKSGSASESVVRWGLVNVGKAGFRTLVCSVV